MERRTPIQVVVIRNPDERITDEFVAAIELAFEGQARNSNEAPRYISDAQDLQIHVLVPDIAHPAFDAAALFRAAAYTIVVELQCQPRPRRTAAQKKFFADIFALDPANRRRTLTITIPESKVGNVRQRGSTGPDEVEASLLPVASALHALELARRTLEAELAGRGRIPERLKFFISHAKIDGAPAAISLVGLMRRLRGLNATSMGIGTPLSYFYDVEDIPPGARWQQVLEDNAHTSVLIVLRTEEYQNRFWCRAEYQWAEEAGMPIVVVDLRTEQLQTADRLPFGVAPAVRVTDGNLLRAILHASASHVRLLRDRSMAKRTNRGAFEVLPRHPSVTSLNGAMDRLTKGRRRASTARIYYPQPRLSDMYLNAVEPMLSRDGMTVKLCSMDDVG